MHFEGTPWPLEKAKLWSQRLPGPRVGERGLTGKDHGGTFRGVKSSVSGLWWGYLTTHLSKLIQRFRRATFTVCMSQ